MPSASERFSAIRGPAHDGEDHAEPGPGDAEADEDLQELVLPWRDREGRKDEPRRVE